MNPKRKRRTREVSGKSLGLWTTTEVAEHLGVTPVTVMNYVKADLLPAFMRLPRFTVFRVEDVERFKRNVWPLMKGTGGRGKKRGPRRG